MGPLIEMQEHPLGKGGRLETLHERRALFGTGAIMQFEIDAQDRGNTDAAGKQQAAPGLGGQGEQVARFADRQAGTRMNLGMQAVGTTARGGVLEYADQVTMPFLRVIAQGVLPNKPIRQVQALKAGSGLPSTLASS